MPIHRHNRHQFFATRAQDLGHTSWQARPSIWATIQDRKCTLIKLGDPFPLR